MSFHRRQTLQRQGTLAERGGGFGTSLAVSEYDQFREVLKCSKTGYEIVHDPVFNKGMAFSMAERERLGIRGLIPPAVVDLALQCKRVFERLEHDLDVVNPEDVESGGVTKTHARKWVAMQELQDRNEALFYKVLLDRFTELAPVIYTPTVGWTCVNYHHLYHRPRGMFFSAADRGEMAAMVYNWPYNKVDAIVVTDGSRILGLGDLGLNGMGIPIGKLDLYVAAAGFHPQHVLPCVLDVGTNNDKLRDHPLYMGLRQHRLQGKEYYDTVEEFVSAVMGRWPRCVLQFEDFSTDHAQPLLDKYRDIGLVFNDDIQGTACVAVAGIFGALAVLGKQPAAICDMNIVMVGAGSAGMGVAHFIRKSMMKYGASETEASNKFYVLDQFGLITQGRSEAVGELVEVFRRPAGKGDLEGESLPQVVKRVKPHILIGLSGAGRLFTSAVLTAMGEGQERPIIFPMSNPTSRMECTSQEAFTATQGRCIFGSGSPQPDVTIDGKLCCASQSNNIYIFPGVAYGAHLGDCGVITDEMLMAAAEALPQCLSKEDLAAGRVYPPLTRIREVSVEIAAAVIECAYNFAHLHSADAEKAMEGGPDMLRRHIRKHQYVPDRYPSIIRVPPHLHQ